MEPGCLSKAAGCGDLDLMVKLIFFSSWSLVSHLGKCLSAPVEMLPGSVMSGPLGAKMPVLGSSRSHLTVGNSFHSLQMQGISCPRASSCDRSLRGETERENWLVRSWVAYL